MAPFKQSATYICVTGASKKGIPFVCHFNEGDLDLNMNPKTVNMSDPNRNAQYDLAGYVRDPSSTEPNVMQAAFNVEGRLYGQSAISHNDKD
jgi:hypothetical protein